MRLLPTPSPVHATKVRRSLGRTAICTSSTIGLVAPDRPVLLAGGLGNPTRQFSMKLGLLVDAATCTRWWATSIHSRPTVATFFLLVFGQSIVAWPIPGCAGSPAPFRTSASSVLLITSRNILLSLVPSGVCLALRSWGLTEWHLLSHSEATMARRNKSNLLQRVKNFQPKASKGRTTAFLPLRIPPAAKVQLQRAADERGVSLNSYMQDLVLAKANGRSDADAIEEERGHSAQREVRSELETSTASVRAVRDRLDGLRKFWRGMVADVEATVRAGKFSWWGGEPDEETKRMLGTLETQMRACADSLAQTRAAILAARPGKGSAGQTVWDSIVGEKS